MADSDTLFPEPRQLDELGADETGQMTVEWIMVTGFVILPLGMTVPGIMYMYYLYFYRVAGVIAFPFP